MAFGFKFWLTKYITMKLTAVLAITLGAMLLSTMMVSVSHANENSVKVYAKEKRGLLLLLVKNGTNSDIDELKITLLDGLIDSATRQGWKVSKDSANQITVSSTDPIPRKGREIFFINTDNINSIISWAAKDNTGSIIAMDNARAVVKQTLNDVADNSYKNVMSVTVTTDKIFYEKGEKMLISGVLEPNSKITITIYTPSGQKVKISDRTDQIGSFEALHVLHNAVSGTYIVQAREPMALVETAFKVL